VIGARTRQKLAILISAALLAVGALAGSAASTIAGPRTVFFGSVVDGKLAIAPVAIGELTAVRFRVQNDSTQTLTKATVRFGESTASITSPFDDPSLPAGATIADVIDPEGACGWTDQSPRSLTCNFGNLPGRSGPREVVAVIDAGGNNPLALWAAVTINEGLGINNPDTFFADGEGLAFTANDDNIGRVIPRGQLISLATSAGANGLSVGVFINRPSNGDVVAINEDQADFACPAGKNCVGLPLPFGLAINYGDVLTPPADVTINWPKGTPKPSGFSHLLDDGTVDDISLKNNNCSATTLVNCVVSAKGNVYVIRLPYNGYVKGYR
jgi:hypothetical protein